MIEAMPGNHEQILALLEEMQCSFEEALDVIESVWTGTDGAYLQCLDMLKRYGRVSGNEILSQLTPSKHKR